MKDNRKDRGAALVEYALLVALLAVVSLGAISNLRESSGDELEERELSSGGGVEVSGAGFSYGGGGGSSGGGGGGGGTPSTVTIDSVTFPTAKGTAGDKVKGTPVNWIANVTVQVASGTDKIENAIVTVSWTDGATTTTVQCPGATNKQGKVECELTKIPMTVSEVTLTIVSVTGTNLSYTVPSPPPSQIVDGP